MYILAAFHTVVGLWVGDVTLPLLPSLASRNMLKTASYAVIRLGHQNFLAICQHTTGWC